MDGDKKKVLIIGLVIVAAVLAAGSAFFTFSRDQVHVERQGSKPPPGKLWGKAAMMQHDNGQGKPGAPSPAKGAGNPANGN